MAQYKIVKSYSTTSTDREIAVWNVVDAVDGYVYDTFSLKRDAAEWVKKSTVKTPNEKQFLAALGPCGK